MDQIKSLLATRWSCQLVAGDTILSIVENTGRASVRISGFNQRGWSLADALTGQCHPLFIVDADRLCLRFNDEGGNIITKDIALLNPSCDTAGWIAKANDMVRFLPLPTKPPTPARSSRPAAYGGPS